MRKKKTGIHLAEPTLQFRSTQQILLFNECIAYRTTSFKKNWGAGIKHVLFMQDFNNLCSKYNCDVLHVSG